MGERTSHPPGTFSWTDLSTTDPDGARAFYSGLFGWDTADTPLPGGGVYTMLVKGGRYVAALSAARDGHPPAWNSYVTVESADAAAASAAEHGGTLAMEPFDVMDAGRMALVQDPTGAFFAVWEPRDSIGAQLVNEPGTLTINQLNSSEPARAQEFYEGVFGWRFESLPESDQRYWGIYNGDRLNAGMTELQPDAGAPSHWLVYFGCESVNDDAGRIADLGGQVVVPPLPIPAGRILVAQDPQGAFFALFSGEFDD
ncbi:MAG: VOC family protein [Thermoleophilaceae bacterium]|nr:VOC family protein [Thermoleophilaceae bacterium]